jgi:hypothetical protein
MVADIASKPNTVWREILIFTNKQRFERVKQRLNTGLAGYNVVYYDKVPSESPPRLTFVIVDNEEVFFYGEKMRLAVRHPDIVKYFSQYYEDIWKQGKPLKVTGKIEQDLLEQLESLFK